MASLGIIAITGGNLRNDHLYLTAVLDLFPRDAIGGPNDDTLGVPVEIHCGIDAPVVTDIAGDKKIFRRRAWVKEFFQAHAIVEGDRVVVERTGPRRFHVYPARAAVA